MPHWSASSPAALELVARPARSIGLLLARCPTSQIHLRPAMLGGLGFDSRLSQYRDIEIARRPIRGAKKELGKARQPTCILRQVIAREVGLQTAAIKAKATEGCVA